LPPRKFFLVKEKIVDVFERHGPLELGDGRIMLAPANASRSAAGAARSGPGWRIALGHLVLVTDIDPRFIERSGLQKLANIELRRHDIGIDPLPEQAFDLIHARLVLQHVP
jgi:hypothetical protein